MAPETPHFEWIGTLWIPITFALHHYKMTLKKKGMKKILQILFVAGRAGCLCILVCG